MISSSSLRIGDAIRYQKIGDNDFIDAVVKDITDDYLILDLGIGFSVWEAINTFAIINKIG